MARGRPRKYDPEEVRRRTVTTFHRHGFAATSLSELEDRTGLNRRQLYNDFGNKKTMFVRALQDFSLSAGEQFLGHLEAAEPTGVEAARRTLLEMIELADTPAGRLGCLICNTAREPVAADADVCRIVDRYFRRIEAAYRRTLLRAQQLRQLAAERDVDRLARFLLTTHVGICLLARAGEDVSVLRDAATEALASLS